MAPDLPTGPEWQAFLALSARIGGDPDLVQGAGGNTSLKCGDWLWIKASGRWLEEAGTASIMVPVRLGAVVAALRDGRLKEADIAGMTAGGTALRASVETPFHAILPAACVVHVHCVATLAVAIRPEAEAILGEALAGLDWAFVPYLKPGVDLTFEMMRRGITGCAVIVLGNHGLIVTGDTPAAAEALLSEVRRRLEVAVAALRLPGPAPEPGYQPLPPGPVHALACDPDLLRLARRGALAPDFVVFFGPELPCRPPGDLAGLAGAPLPLNAVVLVEGQGVLVRSDAMRGTTEILHGLWATLARFRARGAGEPVCLTGDQVAELMSWEAEAWRQAQNRS